MTLHTLTTYKLIGSIISFKQPKEALVAQLQDFIHWKQLVYHSSKHLLLPTLYKRLEEQQLLYLLPEDLKDYLKQIYSINFNRNQLLLKQVTTLHQIFTQANIQHVFLKGAAMLIKGSEAERLERMVGDIDILVAKDQLQQAFNLLQEHGYTKSIGFDYEVKHFRHLDRQISEDGLAAVELHDELIRHPKQHLVNAAAMLEQRVVCNGLPIPNAYFMGLHSVMAFQVNDLGYYYKRVSFKTLYDSLLLQLPQQSALVNNLQNQRYGRFFLAWAQAFSEDYAALPTKWWQRLQIMHLYTQLRLPLYSRVLNNIQAGLEYLNHRIPLWLTNRSYRQHIIKHKFKNPSLLAFLI